MSKSNMFDQLSANQPEAPGDTPTSTPTRPLGKRSDPQYVQSQIYLKKTLKAQVQAKLLLRDDLDLSELTGQLLSKWLETQP